MDPLVVASVQLQKLAARWGAFFLCLLLGVGLAFLGGGESEGWAGWVSLGFGGVVAHQGWSFTRTRLVELDPRAGLGFFAGLVGLTQALLFLLPDEGLRGASAPAQFVLLMVAATHLRARQTLVLVAFAVALDLSLRLRVKGALSADEAFLRAAFLILVSGLPALLFRGELKRVRELSRKKVEDEVSRLHASARSYRLIGNADSEERGLQTGALEVSRAVDYALGILKGALALETAAFYSRGERGKLVLQGASAMLDLRTELLESEGIVSIALSQREHVVLAGDRATRRAPVYLNPETIGALALVPVLSTGNVEGLLYLDRRAEHPFETRELELAREASQFVLRVAENERVFSRLERQTREQTKLYRAAESLGAATTEADVIEIGVESAREVAAFDFAAVTLFHKKSSSHEICAVSGGSIEHLVGVTFRHNAGLVSMVVANRHALPYRGDYDAERQIVFARGHEVQAMPSLLVLPLVVHDRVLGTLVLGSRKKGAFNESVRPTLEVLASHIAVSWANARMMKRLEEQATTDGMTGLLNKRTLIAAAERRIKIAERFQRPLSVLVTDIDFFKRVNDTYGHDVGDVVIKGLGAVLKRMQRDTDVMGRFGGEEFVIVCEQTDEEGACNLAERIRRELEVTTFQTELGPLSVTCSIGVATFPRAGRDWEALFKATDEALYVSKREGRNRVTLWRPRLKSETKSAPVKSLPA